MAENVASEEEITCPYCGHVHVDMWRDINLDPCLEGEFNFDCDGCYRTFGVRATRVVTFLSIPIVDEPERQKVTLKIADWSEYPAGRTRDVSNHSGEAFRDDVLAPMLGQHKFIHIDLNGVLGYGSSWLEEAFGGLVRVHGFDGAELLRRLTFTHVIESDILNIRTFIEDAARRAKQPTQK